MALARQAQIRINNAFDLGQSGTTLEGKWRRNTVRSLQSGVILISLVAALASYSVSQQNVAEVVKQSSDAVVLIVISNSAGQETALGSGFLVSADGEIVTNHHVIKDAHSAIVKLSNGAFFPVTGVLADDSERDLAIIKVDGRNL